MGINLHNYEAWFLDYIEGTLTAAQQAELMAFLEQHPELQAELDEVELVSLEGETIEAQDFSSLKMPESEGAITGLLADDLLIAETEGVATSEEKAALAALLQAHPTLEADRKLYAASYLAANEALGYANKAALKRSAAIIPLFAWRAVAAAAAIALFVVLFWPDQPVRVYTAATQVTLPDTAADVNFANANPNAVANFFAARHETPAAVNSATVLVGPARPQAAAPQRMANRSWHATPTPTSGLVMPTWNESELMAGIPELEIDELPLPEANGPYFTLRELVVRRVKDRVAQEDEPETLGDQVTLANAVNMASRVSGFQMKMEESFDEQGDRKAWSFATKRFSISRNPGQSTRSVN